MNKKNVVISLLVAALAWDGRVSKLHRKRFESMNTQILELMEERNSARELANLYARALNDRNIKLDAFEEMIMHDLTK